MNIADMVTDAKNRGKLEFMLRSQAESIQFRKTHAKIYENEQITEIPIDLLVTRKNVTVLTNDFKEVYRILRLQNLLSLSSYKYVLCLLQLLQCIRQQTQLVLVVGKRIQAYTFDTTNELLNIKEINKLYLEYTSISVQTSCIFNNNCETITELIKFVNERFLHYPVKFNGRMCFCDPQTGLDVVNRILEHFDSEEVIQPVIYSSGYIGSGIWQGQDSVSNSNKQSNSIKLFSSNSRGSSLTLSPVQSSNTNINTDIKNSMCLSMSDQQLASHKQFNSLNSNIQTEQSNIIKQHTPIIHNSNLNLNPQKNNLDQLHLSAHSFNDNTQHQKLSRPQQKPKSNETQLNLSVTTPLLRSNTQEPQKPLASSILNRNAQKLSAQFSSPHQISHQIDADYILIDQIDQPNNNLRTNSNILSARNKLKRQNKTVEALEKVLERKQTRKVFE
ncbi:Hypothetical_protein [Hexamita inflata]|uniref:Hypothetical_protein n=1 Tax=Hexamita inflata TaxID=28002 RepID=A0AA86QZJ0_9EUKA|nr:Hypothetical protein HINF_LOCUS21116 [Hexamita inflata]CAI9968939.1 Hypothetical protein HINF_LOCUS56584 [Hexamita inflata]